MHLTINETIDVVISFFTLNNTDIQFLKFYGKIVKIVNNTVEVRVNNVKDISKIAENKNVRFISLKNSFSVMTLQNESSVKGRYPEYIYLLSADVLLDNNFNFSLKDVIVAVPDSGIVQHNHFNKISIRYGFDFVDKDNYPLDEGLGAIDYGHGTHVAGIISGKGSYQDYIISGTSPDASLLISRIFGRDIDGDSKLDNYYDIDLDGYQLWKVLLDPDGDGNTLDSYSADVISCSWSDEKNYGVYDLWSKTVDDIISGKMFVKRPIFVFAAGNSGNYNLISPPATSKNSIVVGSCINFDCSIPAKYTQLGSGCGILKPDIFAPGNNIISSIPYSISRFGYGKFSGTSMATPFVSSVAAQLVKLYSSFSKPEFVKAMIISSSYGGSTTDSKSTEKGWGRLSVYQTLFKVDDEILDYYDIGIRGVRISM